MSQAEIMNIFNEGLWLIAKIAGPILLASVVIGLIVAIFQAATQIHEQTLTFVPKLIVIAFIFLISGSWMLRTMIEFIEHLFNLMIGL
ncbi:MAG TPA: flagellar biosynthesis protein FliQ [Erysipelotrichaceae bacterium]|nr:flagellar biosynthesis protein FliQ [Erysipelotrichaceae bacterium]